MILVTGATGFIGKRFIKILAKYYPKDKILCLTPRGIILGGIPEDPRIQEMRKELSRNWKNWVYLLCNEGPPLSHI